MSIINKFKYVLQIAVKITFCAILACGCTPKDPSENDLRSPCMRQSGRSFGSPKPVSCPAQNVIANADSCPTTKTKCNI